MSRGRWLVRAMLFAGGVAAGAAALPALPRVVTELGAQARTADAARDVRQLVTFLFQPGKTEVALGIYERDLLPAYRALQPLRQFRVFREAESPEPLDVVVVSSYDGMAGMDAANAALRTMRTTENPRPVFAVYGELAALSQHHHDQFVEIDRSRSDRVAADSSRYVMFEYLRVAPSDVAAYIERRGRLRPAPRQDRWMEIGRLLLSDGWTVLVIHHVSSLAALETLGRPADDVQVAARKVIIMRQDSRFSLH